MTTLLKRPGWRASGPATLLDDDVYQPARNDANLNNLFACHGRTNFLVGKRFWLSVKRPAGVQLKLAGKPLSLPAAHNVKVLVTPTKTTRVTG